MTADDVPSLWIILQYIWDLRNNCRHLLLPRLLCICNYTLDKLVRHRGGALQASSDSYRYIQGIRLSLRVSASLVQHTNVFSNNYTDTIMYGRLLAAFVMPFAMQNLGWKFYFINAAWNLVFLILAYFTFVETKSLALEAIAAKFGDDMSCLEGAEVGEEQSEIVVKPKE